MEDIKQKIIDFYEPELFGKGVAKLRGGRFIQLGNKRKVYLTFGKHYKDEKEAIEGGAYRTTPHDLFVLLFPEEVEKLVDKRTEKYLEKLNKTLGLVDYKAGYEEEDVDVEQVYTQFIGGDIEVGKTNDGKWLAQYSKRTDVDDYVVVRMYFSRFPSQKDVETAKLLKEIEHHFMLYGYDAAKFNCWECGKERHWLDIPGGLREKWPAYLEKYCGC